MIRVDQYMKPFLHRIHTLNPKPHDTFAETLNPKPLNPKP